jgi:hypothetical protein
MPNRLIPDDEDFWALLERGEEPLLLQLAVAEDGERDSDQPYRLPVPIADRVALAAYHRVQDALAQQRRQPQRRLLGPDGRYEHLPLLLVDLPGEDLDVLDGALQGSTGPWPATSPTWPSCWLTLPTPGAPGRRPRHSWSATTAGSWRCWPSPRRRHPAAGRPAHHRAAGQRRRAYRDRGSRVPARRQPAESPAGLRQRIDRYKY